jgi:hypothetical protein
MLIYLKAKKRLKITNSSIHDHGLAYQQYEIVNFVKDNFLPEESNIAMIFSQSHTHESINYIRENCNYIFQRPDFLDIIISNCNKTTMKSLLALGIIIDLEKAIFGAAFSNNIIVCKYLIKEFVRVNGKNNMSTLSCYITYKKQNDTLPIWYLKKDYPATPWFLNECMLYNSINLVDLLLEKGYNIQWNIITYVAYKGPYNIGILRYILGLYLKTNVINQTDKVSLLNIVQRYSPNFVNKIIDILG